MASIIRIKRSSSAGNPGTLAAGELAYSALTDNGSNGGDRLYVGIGTETSGNAANHYIIGGKYYTDLMAGTAGTLNTSAKSVPILSSSGTIDKWYVGNVYTSGNTITTTDTNGNLVLNANGTGKIKIADTWTLPRTAGTNGYILTTDGNGTATWSAPPSGNTSSSVTFNNSGSGSGSGASFDGSTAITVSYNTIGASPSAGSTSITTLGTITTGVWNSSSVIGVAYGGTGTTTGSITGTGALSFTAASGNNNINLVPTGTGTVDVNSKRITSVATPTSDTDAANKAYVDAAVTSLHVHDSCIVATTNTLAALTGGTITYSNGTSGNGATLTLSGSPTKTFLSADTFDSGVTAIIGTTRVLVKNQTAQLQNGIYVVTSSTVLTRATDFDSTAEAAGGDFVFVTSGTTNADTGWVQTTDNPTLGTDAIVWTQFSGAGTITAGNGLTQSGNTINVVGTSNRISVSADSIDIDSNYVGQTSITTLGTITTGTWNSSTAIGSGYGGTGFTTYTKGDLIYASATNTLSKLSAGSDGQVLQMNSSGVQVWGDIDGGTY